MSIFSFKKRKKKNTIANKLNSILKYRRKLILPVFLFTLIISAASIITLANFGGGQTDDTPNLQRGLVGHWTMDSSSYVEGTENLVLNPSFSDGTTNNWTASGLGGVTNNGYFSSHSYDLISAEGTAHLLRNNVNLSSGTYYMTVWYENIEGQVPYFWTTGFNGSINIINDFSSGPGLKKAEVIIQATDTTNHPSIRYAAGSPADRLEGQVRIYGIQIEEKLHPTPFVDGTRQTRLADSTSYENHGTSDIYNSPSLVSDRSGKEKGAMEFNNVTRPRISFPEISFEDSEPHSGSMWVKINDGITGSPIGGFGWSNMIRLTSTAFQYRPGGGSAQTIASFSSINDNNWHLISWTVESNNNISVYVDGEFEGSSILNDTNIYYDSIGNGYVDHPDYNLAWNGYIDDVRIYDRVLLSEEISLLYDSYKPQLQVSSLNSGLVGHWTLDEVDYNPSTNRVSDLTPYSNHITRSSAIFTQNRFNKENGAMSFNGSQQVSGNLDDFSFSKDQNFTASIWFNIQGVHDVSGSGLVMGIFGSGSGFMSWGIDHYWDGNQLRLGIRDTLGTRITALPFNSADYNKWHHVALVYNKEIDRMRAYLNGSYISQTGTGIKDIWTRSDNNIHISGNSTLGGSNYRMIGFADDARIYNRALSEQEISQLYNSYKPKITPNLQKGLVLDMPLTSVDYNPSTERVSDRTPYENHGVNNGATFTNEGADFNGISDYVNVGKVLDNVFNGTNSWTLSQWVNYSAGYTYYPQFSVGRHSDGPGFTIHGVNGRIQGGDGVENGYDIHNMFQEDLRGKGWKYTVITYDGSIFRSYVDGSAKGTYNWVHGVGNTSNYNMYLGRFWGPYGAMKIKNVRIYNRALSTEEVELLYARGR
jgi:hypothetical protein